MSAPQRHQRGVALVLVLWVLVLLMVIAASTSVTQRNEVGMTSGMVAERKARAAIGAAQYYMLYRMTAGAPTRAEDIWKSDGVLREWSFEGRTLRIAATPESGRIDINLAPPDLIDKLLGEVGVEQAEAEAIRDAILDWKDPDSVHRLLGAEDPEYAAAGYPYGAKDVRFSTVEELRQVMGVTPAIYESIKSALTIYTGQRTVNPIFASPLVIRALPGLDHAGAEAYIAERNERLLQGQPAAMPVGVSSSYVAARGAQIYRFYAEVDMPEGPPLAGEVVASIGPAVMGGRRGRPTAAAKLRYTILERNDEPRERPIAIDPQEPTSENPTE